MQRGDERAERDVCVSVTCVYFLSTDLWLKADRDQRTDRVTLISSPCLPSPLALSRVHTCVLSHSISQSTLPGHLLDDRTVTCSFVCSGEEPAISHLFIRFS